MKGRLLALTVAFALAAPAAHATWWGTSLLVRGNDTGGIIPWTPETEWSYEGLAAAHCARYYKGAFITSVHKQYGDYVSFICAFPKDYDPRKMKKWWQVF